MDSFIDRLATAKSQQEFNPTIVGRVHSYDFSTGEENLRRLRVVYFDPEGNEAISPLLYRVVDSPNSDPPVPKLNSVVVGLWTQTDRSAGVYFGIVQNTPINTSRDGTTDWFEVVEGDLVVRARSIHFFAEEDFKIVGNVEFPNYSQLKVGDKPGTERASHIEFRDGFGCEIDIRTIYNAVLLDESPDL